MTTQATGRFDPAMLDGLDEPMRRYFLHALAPGAVVGAGTRLSMTGRIEVGIWLTFRAVYTTRSGAERPAAEAMGAPASPLPTRAVRWHAESDEVLADRRFGDITQRISVGWWCGAPRDQPFFEATITAAEPTLG